MRWIGICRSRKVMKKILQSVIGWVHGSVSNSKKSGMVWNTVSGIVSTGQTAVVLFFISFKREPNIAGIVSIGFATANLFGSVCRYGVRNYQATDSREKFSFSDYFYARCLTVFLSCMLFFGYTGYLAACRHTAAEKIMVMIQITLLKLIDAWEDVYIGRCQQVGRLDIGAKILSVRLLVSTACICMLLWIGANTVISFFGGVFVSFILVCFFIPNTARQVNAGISTMDKEKIRCILKNCMPLCAGTTLSVYIGNLPKYMIDAYSNEGTQAVFAYIMMPVFAVTLLNQFLYQPKVKDIGDLWRNPRPERFFVYVLRQCVMIAVLTVVSVGAGWWVGLPILSVLYHVDLTHVRTEFAVLLLGGGFYALAGFLHIQITVLRRQGFLSAGYTCAVLVSFLTGKLLVTKLGLLGAAWLYCSLNAWLSLLYFAVFLLSVKKLRVRKDRKHE